MIIGSFIYYYQHFILLKSRYSTFVVFILQTINSLNLCSSNTILCCCLLVLNFIICPSQLNFNANFERFKIVIFYIVHKILIKAYDMSQIIIFLLISLIIK